MLPHVLALALSAAPEAKLDEWVSSKNGSTRQLSYSDKSGAHVVRFQFDAGRERLDVVHTVGKKTVWSAKDFNKDCEFDRTFEVVEGSVQLTDLDDDGEPEISFIYRVGCRSDVSPITVKLLMYEGATKYALRGGSRERVGENEFMGGDFTPDPAFDKAPAKFLEFAKAQWKKLVFEATP